MANNIDLIKGFNLVHDEGIQEFLLCYYYLMKANVRGFVRAENQPKKDLADGEAKPTMIIDNSIHPKFTSELLSRLLNPAQKQ